MNQPTRQAKQIRCYKGLSDFTSILETAGIDISSWGKNTAKTLKHLAREVVLGESILEIDNKNRITRRVDVAVADIYFSDNKNLQYRLEETKQVFSDGRIRYRSPEGAVYEKIKPNEAPSRAVKRGVYEELGISGNLSIMKLGNTIETTDSASYPGLECIYNRHYFRVTLNESQFNLGGYSEIQKDKKTIFRWSLYE